MNFKVIKSEYDEDTKISTAVIRSRYGTFSATVKLHEWDAPYESKFQGCKYAIIKAQKKMLKEKKRLLRERLKALQGLYKSTRDNLPSSVFESTEALKIVKQIEINIAFYKREIERCDYLIYQADKNIDRMIEIDHKYIDMVRDRIQHREDFIKKVKDLIHSNDVKSDDAIKQTPLGN